MICASVSPAQAPGLEQVRGAGTMGWKQGTPGQEHFPTLGRGSGEEEVGPPGTGLLMSPLCSTSVPIFLPFH